jgi:ubiquinone/menaquinone biosynthesis C-methylase UbiE
MKQRNAGQKLLDFLSFPLRAITLFHKDRWGLSCLASERFDYVAREVRGHCLDVGCGRHNRFLKEYCGGNGHGIDVFAYEGLTAESIVPDLTHLPFADATFESVTFIANLNHCPKPDRDAELRESRRVLKPGGNIIITMGNPVAEVLVHKLVWAYDRLLRTNFDMDNERGMHEDEDYYLLDREILARLGRTGFERVRKKYFLTQWGLNHLFVGWKPAFPPETDRMGSQLANAAGNASTAAT